LPLSLESFHILAGRLRPTDMEVSQSRAGTNRVDASDLRLLRDLEGVVNFDAEVPHCRLQLGVPRSNCTARRFLVRR
jgi:hypothetical protein